MFRFAAFTFASLALFAGANAQTVCASGQCYVSPSNATALGCEVWAGGVDAWATCGFEGAVTCTSCFPCVTDGKAGGCYTSPNQATGAGCIQWAGGVGADATCGFDGAITCITCSK
ncbi:hypothetical protein B0H11DRAFT_633038 [Mycena galericulata]|nr:hypothetical protein B0H11DRAFT_633038 [Mycena galericulata]